MNNISCINKLIFVFIALFIWLLLSGASNAHNWYDKDCCNGKDCFPVIEIIPDTSYDKYIIEMNGKTRVIMLDHEYKKAIKNKIRPSKDEKYHICFLEIQDDFSSQIYDVVTCLYEPLNG